MRFVYPNFSQEFFIVAFLLYLINLQSYLQVESAVAKDSDNLY